MPETPEIVEVGSDAPDTESVGTGVAQARNLTVRPDDAPDLAAEAADAFRVLYGVAKQVSKSDFVPDKLRNKDAQVFAVILQGRALGVDPMTALREIWITPGGSPELSAELQAALVRKAGHKVTGTASREGAELTGTRGDTGEEMTVTFTIEDAVEQGLVELKDGKPYARSSNGKPLPWERFTEQMLWHRAMTTLIRRLFSDVLVGEGL